MTRPFVFAVSALRPLGFVHSHISIAGQLHRVYQLYSYHEQRPSFAKRAVHPYYNNQGGFRDFVIVLDHSQLYIDPFSETPDFSGSCRLQISRSVY
jgi:hypothetical protein